MSFKIKFFFPEWDSKTDPDYNFITHQNSEEYKSNPAKYGIYAHNILSPPPYDGILVSLKFIETREIQNIIEYLKVPPNLKIMGDCGAFSYVNEPYPPYSVEFVAKKYDELGFDYGVSVDHIVIDFIRVSGKRGEIS